MCSLPLLNVGNAFNIFCKHAASKLHVSTDIQAAGHQLAPSSLLNGWDKKLFAKRSRGGESKELSETR